MLKQIDPERKLVAHVLDESQCIVRNEEAYLKDLRVLQGRSLTKTIIVDSQAFAFQAQLENGIYIPAYLGDKDDTQLLVIQQFLSSLDSFGDVRPLVKKFAGITRLLIYYSTQRPDNSISPTAAALKHESSEAVGSDDDLGIPNEFQPNL